jgi:hypothetical protein
MGSGRGISIERRVLLFETERRCAYLDCNGRLFLSLTKAEALEYTGFPCTFCERWNTDSLSERDIPDWWQDLQRGQKTIR